LVSPELFTDLIDYFVRAPRKFTLLWNLRDDASQFLRPYAAFIKARNTPCWPIHRIFGSARKNLKLLLAANKRLNTACDGHALCQGHQSRTCQSRRQLGGMEAGKVASI